MASVQLRAFKQHFPSMEALKIVNWNENLKPMWGGENCSKGGKYEEEDKIDLIDRYNKAHSTSYMSSYLENYYQKKM